MLLPPHSRGSRASSAQSSFIFGIDSNRKPDSVRSAMPDKRRPRSRDAFRPSHLSSLGDHVTGLEGNDVYKARIQRVGNDLGRSGASYSNIDESVSCLYRLPAIGLTFDSPLNKITLPIMMRFGVRPDQDSFKQLVVAFVKRVCGSTGVVRVKAIRRSGTMSLLLRVAEQELEASPGALAQIRNAVYRMMQTHGPFRDQRHDIVIRPYAGRPAAAAPVGPCMEVLFALGDVRAAEAFVRECRGAERPEFATFPVLALQQEVVVTFAGPMQFLGRVRVAVDDGELQELTDRFCDACAPAAGARAQSPPGRGSPRPASEKQQRIRRPLSCLSQSF